MWKLGLTYQVDNHLRVTTWLWLSRLVKPADRNILGVLFRSTGLWCSPECYQQTSHHQHKCSSVFKNVNMLKFWLLQPSQVTKRPSAWTWRSFLLNWRKRRRVKGGTRVKKKRGGCVKKFKLKKKKSLFPLLGSFIAEEEDFCLRQRL